MKKTYRFIDNNEALQQLCSELSNSSWLAVDTEFERERTFSPELCLVQVANVSEVAIIDPLSINDLEPMYELLFDPGIVKVFHAARQDLEIFFNSHKKIPVPIFDTQLAAPLVGFDEQIGYANLVSKMLGINLSKAHTRTDWKRRPLQEAQLQYAADDVIYLAEIYPLLLQDLTKRGRIDWLRAEFEALDDPQLYLPDVDSVWKKTSWCKKLKGQKLCALQHLTAWREKKARADNLPRSWLMKDDLILNLAQLQPESLSELKDIKGIQERLVRKYGEEIITTLDSAKQSEPQSAPDDKTRKPLNKKEEAMVDVLTAIVKMHADNHNLHPAILAPKKELEKLIRRDSQTLLLKGWRRPLIGETLNDFISGKTSVKVIQDKLVCE
ncbi:MAG: ribonuclease D [Gammaproteobacteria bacterium]|nr:ribonuclease D [Gammaproteobacteria bacterium]